jgi:hypothetical protein
MQLSIGDVIVTVAMVHFFGNITIAGKLHLGQVLITQVSGKRYNTLLVISLSLFAYQLKIQKMIIKFSQSTI